MNVFISHAHEDRELVSQLADRLRKAGMTIWLHTDLLPGENWATQLGKALDESDAMIVVISGAAARSPHVRDEISYALGASRYAGRVVPVVVEPTDDIPWVLRRMQSIRASADVDQLSGEIVHRLQQPVG